MTPPELRERLSVFAAAVARYVEPLFAQREWASAADQLKRAANGARDNYRSAGRSRSHKEFTARLAVAVDEIDESQGWLDHLDRCLAPERRAALAPLLKESVELTKILSKALTTATRHESERRIGRVLRGKRP